jgi:hypothetical protein
VAIARRAYEERRRPKVSPLSLKGEGKG